MRWTIGIGFLFATFLTVNALFIWLAVSGRESVDPTYMTELR